MIELENAVVYHGSNLDVLPTLPDNSVDAIVTDPPYELGFMGKSWDSSGIAYSVELWAECLRVLKPGGHLLAFGGSRTWHRIAVAIEDAGFDVRDSIAWLYGSGFPKSLDISKAIDKAAGAEREVLETIPDRWTGKGSIYQYAMAEEKENVNITAPATEEAKKWQGWGTALKPAFEPIVVARKPLVGTVAANVLAFGTGGLNIDASRIGYQGEKPSTWFDQQERKNQNIPFGSTADTTEPSSLGRWPANIILDEHTAGLLDEQSGERQAGAFPKKANVATGKHYEGGWNAVEREQRLSLDSGGASRFFYVAKASKKDRNEGLEELEGKEIGAKGNGLGRTCATCSASVLDGCECADRTFVNPTRQNFHPTVKPTALMEYLVKLVTPPGGTVLDPFTGSGSTGKAALLNGFKFIGIELTADYLPIIEGRLKHAAETYANQATEEANKEQETLF